MTGIRPYNRDRRGTMSIVSVLVILVLAMLLGMVMNVARQADGKIRMQNAADAAAYSGATVMARAMNTLAFTNHLLCEVFAMTAFLREADTRVEADASREVQLGEAEQQAAKVLHAWRDAWTDAMRRLPAAPEVRPLLERFERLGIALLDGAGGGRIGMEEGLIEEFSKWAKQTADLQLPLFESILAQEMLPEYQRRIAEFFPEVAQAAAEETARRNGRPGFGRGDMGAALWTGQGAPVVAVDDSTPALPVAAPAGDSRQSQQRRELSEHYLDAWNDMLLWYFDFDDPGASTAEAIQRRRVRGTLSQFGNIWRRYTRAYLEDPSEGLLAFNADRNHLYQIQRELLSTTETKNNWRRDLEQRYSFLATVYWRSLPHSLPGLFHDPTGSDAVAYAEARIEVSQPRLVPTAGGDVLPQYFWHYVTLLDVPAESADRLPPRVDVPHDEVRRIRAGMKVFPYREIFDSNYQDVYPYQRHFGWSHVRPDEWTLLNQNWTARLVPAANPLWADVLATLPPVSSPGGGGLRLPDVSGLGNANVQNISPH